MFFAFAFLGNWLISQSKMSSISSRLYATGEFQIMVFLCMLCIEVTCQLQKHLSEECTLFTLTFVYLVETFYIVSEMQLFPTNNAFSLFWAHTWL